jgi:hypothetical protein
VLFEAKYGPGIADGSITLTFRRWKRSQAVAGHTYRTAAGRLTVEAVDLVEVAAITTAQARRAGYGSADRLRADLRGASDQPVYRVRFRPADDPDPRDQLAATTELDAEGAAEIDRRLARLDRASSWGPWTGSTLQMIARRPGVRAGDLAASVGRETAPFKLDVRKLKALGLTLSLTVGYQLSPRGQAYLARQA